MQMNGSFVKMEGTWLLFNKLVNIWFCIIACSSPIPHLIEDGYCDDENNNAGCGFDGGDCCGPDVKTLYCTECECLGENIVSKAASGPAQLKYNRLLWEPCYYEWRLLSC